ncbi:dTDP-glucose 4,6-dehydratase [Abditibacteriota bacterium]|nr:dTDP-glucose 4,6-dehydratase [Abditibacteriota bacterium]
MPIFSSIPDGWPSPALRATINESRPYFSGQRVLVSGANGFVGGHLCRALHTAGARVSALDIDFSPSRGTLLDLTGLRCDLDLIEADICNRHAIAEIVGQGGFSHIFHLAAGASTIEKALTNPYDTIVANTLGLVNLAEGARLLPEMRRPTVIYASTDKVYGDSPTLPYTEETELGGVGVYDASKLCADILAKTYYRALGVPTVVLRMCNIFGPYDLNFNYRLFPKAMRNIFRDGEAPELYMNSLEHFRDYLFVEDAVRAYFHIARDAKCHGRIYNLPGSRYIATPDVLRDIVNLIGEFQDRAAPDSALAQHRWNRSIRIVPSDPNLITISKQHLDGTRIAQETDFKPMVGFKQGLEITANFYLWYFNQLVTGPVTSSLSEQDHFEPILHEDSLPITYEMPKPRNGRRARRNSPLMRPVSFLKEEVLV